MIRETILNLLVLIKRKFKKQLFLEVWYSFLLPPISPFSLNYNKGSDPRKVLQIESIFGKLGEDKQVVEQIEFYLKRFYSTPAREVMEEAAKNLEF